jgi:hypothetical protein
MINYLHETLRQLFLSRIKDDIGDASQVSFELPDEDFRNQVKTLGKNVLNVCLVDLRENRSMAGAPMQQAQPVTQKAQPRRVDCHYLISAWSPATRSVEPTLDEHALLYKAMAALMEAEPLVASRIYGGKPIPQNFPATFRDAELPTVIFPVERFSKVAEFWSATKGVQWKPTIHLIVTLPVVSNGELVPVGGASPAR